MTTRTSSPFAAAGLAGAALSLLLLLGACASAPPDERTNARARNASGGITVVGQVVSFTSDSVVVATTTGEETVQIDEQTEGREELIVGASIAVDALRSGEGVLAKRIRRGGEGGKG